MDEKKSVSRITTIATPFWLSYKSYLNELTEVEVTSTFGYNICLNVNNLTVADDIANSEHTIKKLKKNLNSVFKKLD